MAHPRISFVISTYNRRAILLDALRRVKGCGLSKRDFEILLVDNASPDGTARAVAEAHPDIELLALRENRGACAKNFALAGAQGEYIIFLDDDSFPVPGAVARMIEHFESDPTLGAAVFTITLPDGSRECSAYPNVFIGCGTGFRRSALQQVGGLPEDFFMQAEEYDLSLRLLDAGWRVQSFDDLHVTHLKTPGARYSERVTQFDVRNNLVLIARYFPETWLWPFAVDWMKRYYAIASAKGHRRAYLKGLAQGLARAITVNNRRPISDRAFEMFTKIEAIRDRLRAAKEQLGLQRVLFIDWGKNMLPYWIAAGACGLRVMAIADPKLAGTGMKYHGIPIVDDQTATKVNFDAAIVSNLSQVHAKRRREEWRNFSTQPVIDLFEEENAALNRKRKEEQSALLPLAA